MSDDFSKYIPSWLKKLPYETLNFAGLADLYGINLYCHAFNGLIGGLATMAGAGLGPGFGALGAAGGIRVTKVTTLCDNVEFGFIYGKICAEVNAHTCPRDRKDIKKIRHPSISLETDEGRTIGPKKCPPCPEETKRGKQLPGPEPKPEPEARGEQEYNARVFFGDGPIGTVTEENSKSCLEISYGEGLELSDARPCVFDNQANEQAGGVPSRDLVPDPYIYYVQERVPDFAMPAGTNQQCVDVEGLADLDKVFRDREPLGAIDLADDPEITAAVCKLLRSPVPVSVSCLPPKLTLGRIASFDSAKCSVPDVNI